MFQEGNSEGIPPTTTLAQSSEKHPPHLPSSPPSSPFLTMGGPRKKWDGEVAPSPPSEERCKRSDSKDWQCRVWRMLGKTLCQEHYEQVKRRAARKAGVINDGVEKKRGRRGRGRPRGGVIVLEEKEEDRESKKKRRKKGGEEDKAYSCAVKVESGRETKRMGKKSDKVLVYDQDSNEGPKPVESFPARQEKILKAGNRRVGRNKDKKSRLRKRAKVEKSGIDEKGFPEENALSLPMMNGKIDKPKEFTHEMQDGWGLATDGKVIFGSDGTSSLYQLDPQNFKVLKRSTVRYDSHAVTYLNELEYINGEIWANVWQSDCIARISVEDGEVRGWILLHKLRQQLLGSGYDGIDVLNGIAWDKENERLFVTGKLWPKLYEIKLQQLSSRSLNGTIQDLCQLRLH